MIDPPSDGGLGLDIQTTAHIAGHRDGWHAHGARSTLTSNA